MSTNNKNLLKIFKTGKKNNLNVIDLFSGCGGLSLGFKMAGYSIKGMIDFDEDSLQTAKANNLADNYLNLDLFKENWLEDFSKKIALKEVDIVIAGPAFIVFRK